MKRKDYKPTIGSIIAKERNKRLMSLDEVLAKLGVKISRTYLSKIENRGEIPCRQVLLELTDLFELPPYLLLNMAVKEKILRYRKTLEKIYFR